MHLRRNKSIFAIILLIFMLGMGFLVAYQKVDELTVTFCFRNLKQATAQAGKEIHDHVLGDQEQLNAIAGIIGGFAAVDSQETRNVLSSYKENGMFARLEVLLPNNRVLLHDGTKLDVTGKISYEQEAVGGSHLTGIEQDFSDERKRIIRHYVPIEKNGGTIALLYGVIELEKFPQLYSAQAYDGQAQIYLIDGENGDFILDTWHDTLGNIYQMDQRKMKEGFHKTRIDGDMKSGRSGSVVFLSKNAGEYFYCYYEPVGINRWMVMLTIQESLAFADAYKMRPVFLGFAVFEIVVFICYFLWFLLRMKKDQYEKESQLGRVRYMLDVEKMLFEAHQKPAHVEKALQKIGTVLTARSVFFLTLDGKTIKRIYAWNEDGRDVDRSFQDICLLPYIDECFQQKKSFVLNNMKEISKIYPREYALMKQLDIRNLMFTLVEDLEKTPVGILGAVNMKHEWDSADQLECVSLSFSMALNNIEGYNTIQKMGSTDYLTGLLNRNSLYGALDKYNQGQGHSLACVYADVNGLHELNNHLGHAAGDRMLQFVAAILKNHFGEENVYRIGGDEFLAVCEDEPEEAVLENVRLAEKEVSEGGYRISSGIDWRDDETPIGVIMKQAEKRMREAKRRYYESKGDRKAARELDRQVEQIMVKKKDSDTFLSIIASDFFGVYTVNINTDEARFIFIPPYFQTILDKAEGRFSIALKEYVAQMVAPSDHEKFASFLDYQLLAQRLEQEEAPEVLYRRVDGLKLILRVFKSQDYSEYDKETVWIFEK